MPVTRGSRLIFPVLVVGFIAHTLLRPSRSFQQPMELAWVLVGIAAGFVAFRWISLRRRRFGVTKPAEPRTSKKGDQH